jgi:hypothetical protein
VVEVVEEDLAAAADMAVADHPMAVVEGEDLAVAATAHQGEVVTGVAIVREEVRDTVRTRTLMSGMS